MSNRAVFVHIVWLHKLLLLLTVSRNGIPWVMLRLRAMNAADVEMAITPNYRSKTRDSR